MSHFLEHRRRHLQLRRKLATYLLGPDFRGNRSCHDQLVTLLLAYRRRGRFRWEEQGRFSPYGDEYPEEDEFDQYEHYERGDELFSLYSNLDDPRSVLQNKERFKAACVRERTWPLSRKKR